MTLSHASVPFSLASATSAQPSSPPVVWKSIRPSLSLSTPSSHTAVPRSLGSTSDVQPGSPPVAWKSISPSPSLSLPSSHGAVLFSLVSVGPEQPGSAPVSVKSICASLSLSALSSHAGQPMPVQCSLLSPGALQPGSLTAALTLKSVRPSESLSEPSSHWVVPFSLASVGDRQPGSAASVSPSASLSIMSEHAGDTLASLLPAGEPPQPGSAT